MHHRNSAAFILSLPLLALSACGEPGASAVDPDAAPMGPDAGPIAPDAGPMGLPALGAGSHDLGSVELVTITSRDASGVNGPRDLALNTQVAGQLWIVNDDRAVVIVDDVGLPTQRTSRERGLGGDHFMPFPSALAFGAPGFLATVHEIDEPTQTTTPGDFMGPTLWTADETMFNAGHASHYDMLHNSPNAMGIAWDTGNAFFVFDGYHRSITRYDFGVDHGPGGEDHSDGVIARFVEGEVGYLENVSAHLAMDHATGLLYVADPANARVAVLDTATGTRGARLVPNYDGADMYAMDGATLTTLITAAEHELVRPSGLALHEGTLFVADAETSRLAAFDLEGTMLDWLDLAPEIAPGSLAGIEVDAEGRIYLCDRDASRVMRIAPLAPPGS